MNKAIKLFLILWFCASVVNAEAQSIVSIRGEVFDTTTGQSLTYCNCFLKSSNVGTATGLDGRFDIKTRQDNLPDSLTIQYIGYESRTLAVGKKGKNFGKIALQPHNTELKDVVVKSKPRNWNKTLKGVFDSCIYKTYKAPFVSTVYYNSSYGYNDEEITEVAVNVLFPKRSERRYNRNWLLFGNCGTADESYFVTGLRKTEQGKLVLHPEETHNYYGIFDCNGLTQILNGNVYFYQNSTFERMASKALFKLVKIDTIDGNTVFTIEGKISKKDETTELTISFDETNKTIYSYSLKQFDSDGDGYSMLYNFRITNDVSMPLFFQSIITKVEKGRTFTMSDKALFSDTRQFIEDENLGKESRSKNSFEFQGIIYDKEFWDNYTIVE